MASETTRDAFRREFTTLCNILMLDPIPSCDISDWRRVLTRPVRSKVQYRGPLERVACRELMYSDAVVFSDSATLAMCPFPNLNNLQATVNSSEAAATALVCACKASMNEYTLPYSPTPTRAEIQEELERGQTVELSDTNVRAAAVVRRIKLPREIPPMFEDCVRGCVEELVCVHTRTMGSANSHGASGDGEEVTEDVTESDTLAVTNENRIDWEIPHDIHVRWTKLMNDRRSDLQTLMNYTSTDRICHALTRVAEHETFRVVTRTKTTRESYKAHTRTLSKEKLVLIAQCIEKACHIVELIGMIPKRMVKKLASIGELMLGGNMDMSDPSALLQMCTAGENMMADVDPADVASLTDSLPSMINLVKRVVTISNTHSEADSETTSTTVALDNLMGLLSNLT